MRTLSLSCVFVFLLSAVVDSFISNCPPENTLNGKCYQFVAVARNWLVAEEYCQSMGPHGHLAASANGFVNTLLASETYANCTTDVWIGGNKLEDGSTWTWSDPASRWTYTQWARDFPSTQALAHCASLNVGNVQKSMWMNGDCSTMKSFICQYDLALVDYSPCPESWIYNSQLNNCYRVVIDRTPMTWDRCQQQCRAYGGNMTSIHSDAENDFINEILPMQISASIAFLTTWIGFRDFHPQTSHQFTWIDGTPFDYTNWVDGYPIANITLNCGSMDSKQTPTNPMGSNINKWNNYYNCDTMPRNACVCKKPTMQNMW